MRGGDFWYQINSTSGNPLSITVTVTANICPANRIGPNCEFSKFLTLLIIYDTVQYNLRTLNAVTYYTLGPRNPFAAYVFYYIDTNYGDLENWQVTFAGSSKNGVLDNSAIAFE
jgi:hypothetical protein